MAYLMCDWETNWARSNFHCFPHEKSPDVYIGIFSFKDSLGEYWNAVFDCRLPGLLPLHRENIYRNKLEAQKWCEKEYFAWKKSLELVDCQQLQRILRDIARA